MLVEKKVDLSRMVVPNVKVAVNGTMPNIVGLIGKNVIPQLENQGYRVDYKGVGKITGQFPEVGTAIKKNQRIYLTMQN